MANSIAITMIKKGNYRINVYSANLNPSFFAIDSNEGYWTAFNTLGVSVIKAKTKSDIVDILRAAPSEDLSLYNNQESI